MTDAPEDDDLPAAAPVEATPEVNPLVARLLSVLGKPDSGDVPAFLTEYRKIVQGFGPNVLESAGDRLIRDGGRHWPTPRAVLQACTDVQDAMASRENAASAGRPERKMPWDYHREQAQAWARDYVARTELGQQATAEGWNRYLENYAFSLAKNRLGAGKPIPDIHGWRPDHETITYWRGPNHREPRNDSHEPSQSGEST